MQVKHEHFDQFRTKQNNHWWVRTFLRGAVTPFAANCNGEEIISDNCGNIYELEFRRNMKCHEVMALSRLS